MQPSLHVVLADIHYPEHSPTALQAVFSYIKKNRDRIASVTLLGDALDCQDLSHHTRGKPRLRARGGYKAAIEGFKSDVLNVIERAVKPGTRMTYICGNHEDWIESDLLDEMPELEGVVDIPVVLNLEKRGWSWIPVGGHIMVGKVVLLHGDQIGSGMHVAKKMVDNVADSCVMGHVHTVSSYTKSSHITAKRKWIGHTLGCLCTQAPAYAKGRPNAFVHGFGVIETWGTQGYANIHSIIIMPDGHFSYGGVLY